MSGNDAPEAVRDQRERALVAINEALDGLRYGTIILTVHESRVVQLEITGKRRYGT